MVFKSLRASGLLIGQRLGNVQHADPRILTEEFQSPPSILRWTYLPLVSLEHSCSGTRGVKSRKFPPAMIYPYTVIAWSNPVDFADPSSPSLVWITPPFLAIAEVHSQPGLHHIHYVQLVKNYLSSPKFPDFGVQKCPHLLSKTSLYRLGFSGEKAPAPGAAHPPPNRKNSTTKPGTTVSQASEPCKL